jgi:hypothetical protein
MAAAEQRTEAETQPRRLQRLTAAQLADYERDGYLFLRGLFAPTRWRRCRPAPLIRKSAARCEAVADSGGKPQEVSWSRLSDDLVGVFPASPGSSRRPRI